MEWYSELTVDQKINFKEMYCLITGCKFSDLSFLFSFKERIEIGYNKLKVDGFDI